MEVSLSPTLEQEVNMKTRRKLFEDLIELALLAPVAAWLAALIPGARPLPSSGVNEGATLPEAGSSLRRTESKILFGAF